MIQGETAADQLAGCAGKEGYPNKGVAALVLKKVGKGGNVKPYRCEFCGKWHIGRTRI